MRYLLVASSLLLGSLTPAQAQVRIGVGVAIPSVQIGIHVPVFPELVAVPGYPVYYAPGAATNYFFYDGAYWVYQGDTWYVSSWYDGPWYAVAPDHVPLFVLRVPVRYYRHPPPYFRGWHADAPPRWGHRWGHDWERRHSGWDRWDRRAVPRPAPLPVYQRDYAGHRYPHAPEHQHAIRAERYQYRPHEQVTRTHFEPRGNHGGRHDGDRRQGNGGRDHLHGDDDRRHDGDRRQGNDGRHRVRGDDGGRRHGNDGRHQVRGDDGGRRHGNDDRGHARGNPGGRRDDDRRHGNDDRGHGRGR
jgi:hypothetical protein